MVDFYSHAPQKESDEVVQKLLVTQQMEDNVNAFGETEANREKIQLVIPRCGHIYTMDDLESCLANEMTFDFASWDMNGPLPINFQLKLEYMALLTEPLVRDWLKAQASEQPQMPFIGYQYIESSDVTIAQAANNFLVQNQIENNKVMDIDLSSY